MKLCRFALLNVAVTLLIGLASSSVCGQEIKTEGKSTIGIHDINMQSGFIYLIKVQGNGFRPQVTMRPDSLPYVRTDFNKPNFYQSYYAPAGNERQTVYVVPDVFSIKGARNPFTYNIQVTPVPLAAKPLVNAQDTLAAADPPFNQRFIKRKHHKSYKVMMTAGRYYIINMMRRGAGNFLDCYLYLQDSTGKVVESNDDGGKGLDSRIVFRPTKTGAYTVIATGLGNALGDYTLTVETEKK